MFVCDVCNLSNLIPTVLKLLHTSVFPPVGCGFFQNILNLTLFHQKTLKRHLISHRLSQASHTFPTCGRSLACFFFFKGRRRSKTSKYRKCNCYTLYAVEKENLFDRCFHESSSRGVKLCCPGFD